MLKTIAPIALALSLAAGSLPAAAQVYQAGAPQAGQFIEQQLAGVYQMQPVHMAGQVIEQGLLRVGFHPEMGVMMAQNGRALPLKLHTADTANNSINLIDGRGQLVTFRNVFGVATLTLASGETMHMPHVRALAQQDADILAQAYVDAGLAVIADQGAPVAQVAAGSAPSHAAPSFDCAKASTAIEGMICGSAELAELDSRLAEAYREVRQRADDPEAEKREQVEWVRTVRGACKTVQCLQEAYAVRVNDLELLAQYLSKPREFR